LGAVIVSPKWLPLYVTATEVFYRQNLYRLIHNGRYFTYLTTHYGINGKTSPTGENGEPKKFAGLYNFRCPFSIKD